MKSRIDKIRTDMHITSVILLILLFVFAKNGKAQILINEFSASNTGIIVDPDYKESGDWIELYNAGTDAIDLGGYFLTDNFNNKEKWEIPTGTIIGSNGFLIIWADGYNTGLHTSYKLSADGEEIALVHPSGTVVDSLSFGYQDPNISMGRDSNDISQWVFFTKATPGSVNNTVQYDGIVKNPPNFSIYGGIFNRTISLNLRSLYGGTVRFTTDGSEPDETSTLAATPIQITKTTVVRARIFKNGQVPGPVLTHTYFIDLNNELSDLPVISISSAPENFWGKEKGIYTQDFKPEWEIPVNIELFEKDGRDKAAFNLQAGIKVNGLYAWKLPQKMLGIYFRKEYGEGKLDYPILFDKPRKAYDTFALRASGSDWGNTLFRDGMIQTSSAENTRNEISGFRPSVVYINGEFMGIHNIREKIDEDYIVGNQGLEEGTFDMVEETDKGSFAETGTLEEHNKFIALTSKDLTIQANYDAVAAIMDIDQFTDMVCTEVYSGNSSIGHNLMKWKPKGSGKWKWILMDLDRGFSNVTSQMISFYINEDGWPLKALMKNSQFKKQFGIKLANLLFTTFNSNRIIDQIETRKKAIEADIPNHIKRWKGTLAIDNYDSPLTSFDDWLSEVEKLKTFAKGRPNVILNDLTQYGFQSPVAVSVMTYPSRSGKLTFNGLRIPLDICIGGYPKGETIKLHAKAKAGFRFLGWQTIGNSLLVPREQTWKYSDTGIDLGTSWRNPAFNDTLWKTGQAELGYGDDDEKTVISYGNSNSKKHITSYFRKNFLIDNPDQIVSLSLLLKCDDGAVIYLNGNEVIRYNMPSGEITYLTTAVSTISGSNESDFHSFSIEKSFLNTGNNVLAVEVHQESASSSDMSFDLELVAQSINNGQYLSTNKELVVTPETAFMVAALFENDGKCILPFEITSETKLNKACSPYVTSADVHISASGKLIIEPGVEIWLSDGASIYSEGVILAKGTQSEPIIFKGNPELPNKEWGLISINNASDTCWLSNVVIEDASCGKSPREVGAITAYKSVLKLDSIRFNRILANPIATRFCDVSLNNSLLQSNVVGDLINVTRGKGHIENCEFIGNNLPDNDAIDFNGGSNGVIKNSIIRDFLGPNSDAIDMGEKATNIQIEGLYVHDITDKGVSVGQQSSVVITNSLFTNCNLGVGVKDSSSAVIDHCTFYGVATPVASYEKNAGRAGGNVKVTNSIFSNAYETSYLCDQYSTIDISYSASDNDKLPEGKNNLFVNPLFKDPSQFNFSLLASSPCIGTASLGNRGSGLTDTGLEPEVMISDIAYYTEPTVENLEFIALYNPGNSSVDLSSHQFISGVTFTFPEGASIAPKAKVYVTSNAASSFWNNKGLTVYQWEIGKLADEGEEIKLIDKAAIVIDEVTYNNKAPWPVPGNADQTISLSRFDVDNHFAEYWHLSTREEITKSNRLATGTKITVYPNPTSGKIFISRKEMNQAIAEVYNLNGNKIFEQLLNTTSSTIDISQFPPGIYLLKVENTINRIVRTK